MLYEVITPHEPMNRTTQIRATGRHRIASAALVLGDAHRAGRDRPAEVFALRADAVEGCRRAEVDDDARPVDALVGGDRVDDAVGADLTRVLVEDRHLV